MSYAHTPSWSHQTDIHELHGCHILKHTRFLSFLLAGFVCCMYAFMSFLLLSRGLSAACIPGDAKKKTNMVWCGQISCHWKLRGREKKNKSWTETHLDSEMQNVIAFSIFFWKNSVITILFLAMRYTWGILGVLFFTWVQWRFIDRGIKLWDTELCNSWDLSPFYKLLSIHNSHLKLLPLPSGKRREKDWWLGCTNSYFLFGFMCNQPLSANI